MLNSYNLFPLLPLHTMENCIPFIHRLLKYAYPAIAKECAIQGRLPLSLLNDPTISCNKY